MSPSASPAQQQIARQLQRQIEHVWSGQVAGDAPERFSTGCGAIDRLLPGGGIRRGTLVEWLGQSGATLLAVQAAREALGERRVLVVIDQQGVFYPPAAAAWGMPLDQVVLLRPANQADQRWAVSQALRCSAVAAVLAWPQQADDRTLRRWQLAAESSGVTGLLVCPAARRATPSWAEVRLLVQPQPPPAETDPADQSWTFQVECLRAGGWTGLGRALVQVDPQGNFTSVERHETNPLPVVAELAHSEIAHRPAGA